MERESKKEKRHQTAASDKRKRGMACQSSNTGEGIWPASASFRSQDQFSASVPKSSPAAGSRSWTKYSGVRDSNQHSKFFFLSLQTESCCRCVRRLVSGGAGGPDGTSYGRAVLWNDKAMESSERGASSSATAPFSDLRGACLQSSHARNLCGELFESDMAGPHRLRCLESFCEQGLGLQ